MIRELKREGVTVLLSSHLLDRVQSVCDRVALFQAGRIALMGTVPELARQVLGGGFVVEIEADGGRASPRGSPRSPACARSSSRARAATACWPTATCARGRRRGGRRGRAAPHLSVEEPSLDAIYTRYFQNQGSGGMRREGSPWRGLGVVILKELSDHLTSVRMLRA